MNAGDPGPQCACASNRQTCDTRCGAPGLHTLAISRGAPAANSRRMLRLARSIRSFKLQSAPSVAPAVIAVRVSDVVCCDALNQGLAPWTDPGLPRFPGLHRKSAEHDPGVLPSQKDLRAIGVEIGVQIRDQIGLRRLTTVESVDIDFTRSSMTSNFKESPSPPYASG